VDSDDSWQIALKDMSGSVLRLTAHLSDASSAAAAAPVAAKLKELKDALKPITEDEGQAGEEGDSLEVMFNKLSAQGADYMRHLGQMITDAVESLDALVVTDDEEEEEKEEEEEEEEEEKEEAKVVKDQPKSQKQD